MTDQQLTPQNLRTKTRADKVEILQTECGDQAAQAARYGRGEDESEWREMRARLEALL